MRYRDARRNKGTRGGLRVIIYYFWVGGPEFWLFTVYGKDETPDLSSDQRKKLKDLLKRELQARADA